MTLWLLLTRKEIETIRNHYLLQASVKRSRKRARVVALLPQRGPMNAQETNVHDKCTLGPQMFGVGDFWLETAIIIKI